MRHNNMLSARRSLAATALTAALAVSPAWAQGEAAISGQARAAANGSPLAGVALTLASIPTGSSIQTTTDPEGRFFFQGVRPGEYVLSSVSEGFSPGQLRLALEPREIRVVMLSLDLRRVELGVRVTGDAAALTSTHSPSSTLLTAERLDTMPSPSASIFRRHRHSRAGHDSRPRRLRPIRGHEVALNPSINGVSFWENPHAVFSAGLSPEVIETANVMTGGFPAEYGNRFGGVVDIVTKSGLVMEQPRLGAPQRRRGRTAKRVRRARRAPWSFGYYLFGSVLRIRSLSEPARLRKRFTTARAADMCSPNSTRTSAAPGRSGRR